MTGQGLRKVLGTVSVLAIVVAPAAIAGKVTWDRSANIEQAARELADMWAHRGALGIFKHIEECHEETVTEAEEYTADAEACIVQDVIHSRMSAKMYQGLSRAAREMSGSPKPETVLAAMDGRLMDTARKFKFTRKQIRAIARKCFETGAPVYLKALKEQMVAARKRAASR